MSTTNGTVQVLKFSDRLMSEDYKLLELPFEVLASFDKGERYRHIFSFPTTQHSQGLQKLENLKALDLKSSIYGLESLQISGNVLETC